MAGYGINVRAVWGFGLRIPMLSGLDSSPSRNLNRTSKADTNSSVFGSPLELLIQNSHVWGRAAATQRNADRK